MMGGGGGGVFETALHLAYFFRGERKGKKEEERGGTPTTVQHQVQKREEKEPSKKARLAEREFLGNSKKNRVSTCFVASVSLDDRSKKKRRGNGFERGTRADRRPSISTCTERGV